MKTLLYLLRHGATGHNLEVPYRLQGNNVDEPLAPIGIAQAEAARDMLRPVPLVAVYSSPLSRAKLTADIVAAPHALPVTTVADLREGWRAYPASREVLGGVRRTRRNHWRSADDNRRHYQEAGAVAVKAPTSSLEVSRAWSNDPSAPKDIGITGPLSKR